MDFAFHLLALVNCDLLLEKPFFTSFKDLGQVIHRKTFQWIFPLSVYSDQDYGDGFFFLTKYFPIWYPAWFLVKVKKFLQFLVL